MDNLKSIIDKYGHWELFSTFYIYSYKLESLGKEHPDCKNLISHYNFLIVTNNRANSVFISSKSLVLIWNRLIMDGPRKNDIDRLSSWFDRVELDKYSISKTSDLKTFKLLFVVD